MQALETVLIIVLTLYLGHHLGGKCSLKTKIIAIYLISPTVYLLLFLMGLSSAWVFLDGSISYAIMLDSLTLASFISLCTFLFLIEYKRIKKTQNYSEKGILTALFGCLKVVLAFCFGAFVYYLTEFKIDSISTYIDLTLYLLIFLIGFDISSFTLKGLNFSHWKIPILTLASTYIGALVFSLFSERNLLEIIISVSGFGWFTLSGPMVTTAASPELGMFAFLTDLFRELISIVFLYILGSSYSRGAIGICGAAALDSALPFIKDNCDDQYIKHAIASGFILTVLAPVILAVLCDLLVNPLEFGKSWLS